MKKYIKLLDSVYEIEFNDKDRDLLYVLLASQPTINEFEEFCETFNVSAKATYLGDYCHRSKILKDLVFNERP